MEEVTEASVSPWRNFKVHRHPLGLDVEFGVTFLHPLSCKEDFKEEISFESFLSRLNVPGGVGWGADELVTKTKDSFVLWRSNFVGCEIMESQVCWEGEFGR